MHLLIALDFWIRWERELFFSLMSLTKSFIFIMDWAYCKNMNDSLFTCSFLGHNHKGLYGNVSL